MKLFMAIFNKVFVFGGLLVAGIVFLYVFIFNGDLNKMKTTFYNLKKGKLKSSENGNQKKDKIDKKNNKNKKVKSKEKISIDTSDEFLDFDKVVVFSKKNPVGLIKKKGKNEYVGAVEVFGCNYNLLSIEEREDLEREFAKLLNGIDYPIQIYIQSRKVDIEGYENKYNARLEEIKKKIEKTQSKLEFLKEANEDKETIREVGVTLNKLIAQYNYGAKIKEYMMQRCQEKTMLERKYFIIMTHKHDKLAFKEEQTEQELIHNAFFDINNKANSIIDALRRANLDGKLLSGFELANLLYTAYNKADSEYYKLNKALKSRFSHLYTTAEPVSIKQARRQLENLNQQIEEVSV